MEAGKDSKSLPAGQPVQKSKKGFSVGPDNLPDGVHRRKVQKIKKSLIRKAQIHRTYQKLKAREPDIFQPAHKTAIDSASPEDATPPASLEPHPERQAMLDPRNPLAQPSEIKPVSRTQSRGLSRHARPAPFKKEVESAQQRQEERISREKAFEQADRERESKREERAKFRKAMLKAKSGGKHGNERRLGRESKVLLEKVQRIVKG